MKRTILLLACLCAFAISAIAQSPGGETQPPNELTRQLLLEVKNLRLELLQQRVEFQQWKLNQIERELQLARAEQERLDEEGREIARELAAIPGSADEQKEGESLRAEAGGQLRKLQSRQAPIRERVAELSAQHNREETRMRQLAAQLKAETPAAAK
jgi:chromosome segregation ATPase